MKYNNRPLERAVFLFAKISTMRYNDGMKIYISGQMAKRPNYKEIFEKAENDLTEKGYTVINPAWLPKGLGTTRYMPICMAMIDGCDAIFMLNGWENSKGACLEKAYAEYQEKLIIYESWNNES